MSYILERERLFKLKYIPKKFSYSNGSLAIGVHYDGYLGRISDIDSKKVISKFEDFHKAVGVSFVDENGLEYSVIVGPKTSPINEIVIEIIDDEYKVDKNDGWRDPYHNDSQEHVPFEKWLYLKENLKLFISWFRSQSVLKSKGG